MKLLLILTIVLGLFLESSSAQIVKGTAAVGNNTSAASGTGLTMTSSLTTGANALILATITLDVGPALTEKVNSVSGCAGSWAALTGNGAAIQSANHIRQEAWVGYTTGACSGVTVTVNYDAPETGAGDASFTLQSWTGTAATSGTPTLGIGTIVNSGILTAGNGGTVSVTSSGHNNSLYVGLLSYANGALNDLSAGSGLTMDAQTYDTIWSGSGIETGNAAVTPAATTSVAFGVITGRDSYAVYGIELLVGAGGTTSGSSVVGKVKIAGPATIR